MPLCQPDDTTLDSAALSSDILIEDGVRKAICGYTWPGIEYGEPPCFSHTFFEYVDTIRFGDLQSFKAIEQRTREWWFPTLDRNAGGLLHFAVDHGQLAAIKFLIEHRAVEINQQDVKLGWTPLHRCARMAHYKHAPFIKIFELLLQHGADPNLRAFPNEKYPDSQGQTVLDVVVDKGCGWEEGQVRAELQQLIEKYSHVAKKPAYIYNGPPIGPVASQVFKCWESLPKLYPPMSWRPPPSAGHQGAQGMRRHSEDPWRPAGKGDGSYMMRPLDDEWEQDLQSGQLTPAGNQSIRRERVYSWFGLKEVPIDDPLYNFVS